MISYFLAANCYGFLFYGIYLLLLKDRSSHSWNRFYLLSITLLSVLLPLAKLDIAGWYTASIAHTLQVVALPEITLTASGSQPGGSGYAGFTWLPWVYAVIMGLLLLRMLYRLGSLRLFLLRQQVVQRDGYRLALNTGVGPASFGTVILFPGKEIDLNILNHEKAHLHYRHHYDKLLTELIQCLFFAIFPLYFIRKELALVHEFEADAVAGTDKQSYAYTLLGAQLKTRQFYFLQSFFQHPLKRRIVMLQRNHAGKNNSLSKVCVLLSSIVLSGTIIGAQSMPPAEVTEVGALSYIAALKRNAGSTLQIVAPQVQQAQPGGKKIPETVLIPRQEQPQAPVQTQTMPETEAAPATQADSKTEQLTATEQKVFRSVEQMPQPSVDLMNYLKENIHYPEEARKNGIQGRVVLQFIVNKEGDIENVVVQRDIGGGCGAEAERVVKNLPKFNPGMQDGQPVKVYYTLPVTFRMN